MSSILSDTWNFLSTSVSHYKDLAYVKCVGWTISGRVLRNNAGVDGITVTLSGGKDATAITANGGAYSFPRLWDGTTYTVAAADGNYQIAGGQTVTLAADTTVDFQATKWVTIGGKITKKKAGLNGVTVTCAGQTTTTANGGLYSFRLLEGTQIPIAIAATLAHHGFAADGQLPQTVPADDTNDIHFTAFVKRFSIGGNILGGTGATVTLTVEDQIRKKSDSYTFADLESGKKYVVKADAGVDYKVEPTSKTFEALSQNETAADFTVKRKKWGISVTIEKMKSALLDATISISGDATKSGSPDLYGFLHFGDLDAGGTYTVKVTHKHFTFKTDDEVVIGALRKDTDLTYVATRRTWSISGTVTYAKGASKTVTVKLTGGGKNGTDETDENGVYEFLELPAGAKYTVEPVVANEQQKPDPASKVFDELSQNETFDFKGTWPNYKISGEVTDGKDDQPLPKIPITLSSGNAPDFDDQEKGSGANDGTYSFNPPGGWNYKVKPYLPPYTFDPASRDANPLTQAVVDQDFEATWNAPAASAGRDPLKTTYGLDVKVCRGCRKKPILHTVSPIRETQESLDACRTLYAAIAEIAEDYYETMLGVLICTSGRKYAAHSGSDAKPDDWETAARNNGFVIANRPKNDRNLVDRRKREINTEEKPLPEPGNPISCCAGQKLVQKAIADKQTPKAMTEMWYGFGGRDKKTVTSCETCQIAVAQMLCDLDEN